MNLLFLFFLLWVLPVEDSSEPDLNYIFRSGDDGYNCFRIPAVVSTGNRLIAFAEGRVDGCGDAGNIDIVMKISEDGGANWGALGIVHDDGENTCGNPAPVYEPATGRIHLLTTWNSGEDHESEIIAGTSKDTRRIFYSYSDDGGENWSDRQEITEAVKEDEWTWYATGPGSGIVLEEGSHQGRLMIACDHIVRDSREYYSHVIFSDDHGVTWQLGGSTPQDQVNESEVVQLPGGDLLLNMRNYDRTRKTRRMSRSSDGGKTWSDIFAVPDLIEPICQAGFQRMDLANGETVLAFSNPASRERRENMTVKLSYDEGESWPRALTLYGGPSAYSDLVVTGAGQLGCLFEAGNDSPYEGITWQIVDINNN